MTPTLESFTAELRAAPQRECFADRVIWGLGHLDFDAFILSQQGDERRYLKRLSAAGEQFFDWYLAHHLLRFDPVVAQVRRRNMPVIWNASELLGTCRREEQRDMWDKALQAEVCWGISLPLAGMGQMVCISRRLEDAQADRQQLMLDRIVAFSAIVSTVYRERFIPEPELPPELTDREIDCLAWAKRGKSAWETSRILDIAERTVNFHVQNAIHKLQVTSKYQAVAKAEEMGLILD
ncbi:MAG: autoinducer binding domain-containing protein [Gammaproteobacteria bacterium]|nr:autoinducer binding domain-containing protein [Gammaproteobacteria bacterium]